MMIKQILLVGLGGGIGSIFRYLSSLLVNKYFMHAFPLATFSVNMIGCFLIGLIIGINMKYTFIPKELNLLLMVGFCGGYTTFSTFSADNLRLLEMGQHFLFLFNILLSVGVGLGAVYLGTIVTKL
ncbi:MAG: fluoride efflux transporter CrcB [Candidatus Azobacteroides sp.]|nr:fluoride efflux transporter CrcB [Candidatus Azobacteroides sp.]